MKGAILIFGAGELQISIIKIANELDYQTVVIDPDKNAIGQKYADFFFQVDGDDYQKTLKIAKKFEIKGIVTAATDHPILMMCKIAEELQLPFPSLVSCDTLLDKGKFKFFLKANNIAHAKGDIYSSDDKIKTEILNFPVIVKPVKNSGSRGVLKCESIDKLQSAVAECLKFCKDGTFIIEEYINGDEISVEAYVMNSKVEIVQITDKLVTSPPYNVELGHYQPSKYMNFKSEIQNMIQIIVDKLNINNCILHPELKIDKNSKFTIIEIGPRLGGDYITSMLVPLSTGINIEKIQIQIATNNAVNLFYNKRNSLISFLTFNNGGTVKKIISKKILEENFIEIVDFQTNLFVGQSINIITNSLNRYGHFILQGNNRQKLEAKSTEIMNFLENYLLK